MDSSSSDETGSEYMLERTSGFTSTRIHRAGMSRGERSKRPLEDSDDSLDTGQRKEPTSFSWQHSSTLSGAPKIRLPNNALGSGTGMSLDFDENDSEMEDEDVEDHDILEGPYGLLSSKICWPPPGVENAIANEGDRKLQEDKRRKPGIIYLSSIPMGFNVSRTTGFFSQFGRVGRVFLQPGKYTVIYYVCLHSFYLAIDSLHYNISFLQI